MAYESLTNITDWPAFKLTSPQKAELFNREILKLNTFHYHNCALYSAVVDKLQPKIATVVQDILPVPVRLFKLHDLLSVSKKDIIKTMTSSGTSGQQVSRIFLDKQTASLQVNILSKIVTSFIGTKRLPMLVIDCPDTIKNRLKFSARTAGILGFSIFGRDVTFALNNDMTLNINSIQQFLEKHSQQPFLLFGFTYIVWLHFILTLQHQSKHLDLTKGVLIHGGGWKKLIDQAVSKSQQDTCGLHQIHNYYGMVEQTGSIFMECEQGHFHTSAWSDIYIRDQQTHKPIKNHQKGLIQLLSVIPQSYPGHSLLTEDIGMILGEDNCPCGRNGKYFDVLGRLEQAEARGCSDTYTQ